MSLNGVDQKLDDLGRQLHEGHNILTMRAAGVPMHSYYAGWLQQTKQELDYLPDRFPQKRLLTIQWPGLPSPAFHTTDHNTATYDTAELNRVMNERLAWLSAKL